MQYPVYILTFLRDDLQDNDLSLVMHTTLAIVLESISTIKPIAT